MAVARVVSVSRFRTLTREYMSVVILVHETDGIQNELCFVGKQTDMSPHYTVGPRAYYYTTELKP